MLLIWQILTDRTRVTPPRCCICVPCQYLSLSHSLPIFLILRKWICDSATSVKRIPTAFTRPLCVSTLILFYSIHKCCLHEAVRVLLWVFHDPRGLGSLNKVMRSKLNSAMSVPVPAGSLPSAHTGTRSPSHLAIFVKPWTQILISQIPKSNPVKNLN